MRIPEKLLNQIYTHTRTSAPAECFGFLIGTRGKDAEVHRVVEGTNLKNDTTDRFEMDPIEFIHVEEDAASRGREIIGFYHSHPDGTTTPSSRDLALAWPGVYYLIASIREDGFPQAAVWILDDSNPPAFRAVPLIRKK